MLHSLKSDGSYDYVSVDNGLIYFKGDDFDIYLSIINSKNKHEINNN